MSKRKKNRASHSSVVTAVLVAVAVLCVVFIVVNITAENDTLADQNSLFGVSGENEAALIIDDVLYEERGVCVDGILYIRYETVWNDINSAFYVEEASDTLYMTLEDETFTWSAGDGCLYKDGEGGYYISTDCIGEYSNILIDTFEEPYRIVIRTQPESSTYVSALQDAEIRTSDSIKAEIAVNVLEGDLLVLLSDEGEWSYVSSADGHTGYIMTEYIATTGETPEFSYDEGLDFDSLSIGESVRMAWDYIGSAEDNALLSAMMDGVSGLNVISPTWLSVADTEGNVASLADASYVSVAKETYGLYVWAMVSGYGGDDSSTGEILSSAENRQRCVSQLVNIVLTNNIDGINIDFEDIEEEYAPAYVQFLRELVQSAHASGIVVSVDNYVPGYTDHYRRDAQNDIVDYVIMMGYDEHTAYTSEFGSVASISYVEQGVIDTLEEVDADKLVLGVPFYTRGWTVPYGTDYFESETVFMSGQETFIQEHGIELVWDESVGQYTGSAEGEDARYYIWTEDATSLGLKLDLVNEYGLAGASAWRLGMETDDVWQVWVERLG